MTSTDPFTKDSNMLRLALVFLLIALLAALFGFTSIAWISSEAAQILFFVFWCCSFSPSSGMWHAANRPISSDARLRPRNDERSLP